MSKWLSIIFAGGVLAVLGGILHEYTADFHWLWVLVTGTIIFIGLVGLYRHKRLERDSSSR